jgi:hypothetical protein
VGPAILELSGNFQLKIAKYLKALPYETLIWKLGYTSRTPAKDLPP